MKTTKLGSIVAVVAFAATATWAATKYVDPPETRQGPTPQATQGGGIEGTGVVQYDPAGPADSFAGVVPNLVGNVFDTRAGAPLDTGNVSQMAFYHGGSDATFPYVGVIELSPFNVITVPAFSGLVPFSFNTVPITGAPSVSPPFFAGVVMGNTFASSGDSVGMRSASTLGQGFHAGSLPYGGPNIPLAGRNAMVRVAGSVWVMPVELMDFDIQ
ncbi:MAG: hypothetical protein R2991_00540 [Thermoanaerobaculia bacterium]